MTSPVEYWKRQIAGAPPLLELPTDRPRPPTRSRRAARHRFTLSRELADALAGAADAPAIRREDALSGLLLAAFAALLQRYTGREDLLIGSPVASRFHAAAPLMDPVDNPLPLRLDLAGDPSARELSRRACETMANAFAHGDVTLAALLEALGLEQARSYHPLFQVLFSFRGALPLELEREAGGLDLALRLAPGPDGLTGWFEYATDLFDGPTIARMAGHFQTLLAGMAANPEARVSQLPLLTAPERRQFQEWNQTRADYPRKALIQQLFETQVLQTPEAVAVEFGGRRLTYRALDARANQLARYLQKLGVGPEKLVGLCLDRSEEMLVALLGVLKAGGAYVPLDPRLPVERLNFLVADAGLSVVCSQPSLLPLLASLRLQQRGAANGSSSAEPQAPAVLCLDTDAAAIARESELAPPSGATAENAAYVLYTSGSTGKPKGVPITHRAVVNFLCAMRREPGITSEDTVLAITIFSFDIAALELLLPISFGARVVIAPSDATRDGKAFAQLLDRCGASIFQATPTTWRLLIEAGWTGGPRLKLLCGGEAWSAELATPLLARCGSLWNMYGPTETTIWSAVSKVEAGQPVLIGPPIANTQLYVLDAHLQPVPVGVPGELHIGGDGLARGYLNRPELTAEKFIPNPFSATPGDRLYKTGDIVRYQSDGRLEFLGRIDHLVKIRGFRVELGEIEAVLGRHEAVLECAVVARDQGQAEKQLAAYLALKNTRVSVPELRRYLKSTLPDYMVPAAFVLLSTLPKTPNGKLDRRALPEPGRAQFKDPAEYRSPQTLAEKKLAEIWAEVLGVERIGVDENLFDAGGHSLLVMQISSRIRSAFRIEMPAQTLFAAPTIAELAARVEEMLIEEIEAAGEPDHEALGAMPEPGLARSIFLLYQAVIYAWFSWSEPVNACIFFSS